MYIVYTISAHVCTYKQNLVPFFVAVTPSDPRDSEITEGTVNRIQCTYVNNVTVSH